MISIVDAANQRRLVLEGRLVAPWTAELRTACERARVDLHGRELVVYLKDVTAISQEGENVLLELMNDGLKFRSSGMFTKHVLKQICRRMEQKLQEAT